VKPLSPGEPAQVGRYRLLVSLGEGGMGRVLLGVSPDGRFVALKQVHPYFADDQGFRERFRREVDASRMVSGAYTAAVMDADPDAPTPWLASVFVAGPTLREAVDAAGPLPPYAVRHLAAGLASALIEIHRTGLVHRDLKPGNVLLTDDGPRVIDFGIARAAEGGTELTHTGAIIGSPGFMSPEQAEGRPLTSASDVFSLGALLVMAATGQSPFTGASTPQTLYNVVHTHPELRALLPDIRALAEPCLAKDPARRPTPAQILEFLGPVPPMPRPWPPAVHTLIANQQARVRTTLTRPPRPKRRGLKIALAATAAAVLVGGTITTVILLNDHGAATAAPSTSSAPATTTSAPNPDPLGPDRLRPVDPCKVLPSVPGLGALTPKIDVHLFSCTYETTGGQWLDLTIGGTVRSGSSFTEQLEGLPLGIEESAGGCDAVVPIVDQPDAGIEVNASDAAKKFDKPCDAAKVALGEAVRRIRSGVGSEPPQGSLAPLDPCTLIDRTTAQRIIGPITAIEPRGLHECQWQVAGQLSLSLDRGVPPFQSTDPYYDSTGSVDLGGVTAYLTRKRYNPASVNCSLAWQHRPFNDDSTENVSIEYTTSASSLTVDEVCRQAQDFAKAILPKLPKP
jgi:serine/threonine protein kinase